MKTTTKELNMKELEMDELAQVSGGNPIIIFGLLAVHFGLLGYVMYNELKD